jgi:hypothetical protein
VLYKNVLIGAIPIAIISAYSLQYYQQVSFGNIYSYDVFSNFLNIIIYILSAMVLSIYLSAMTGAVLKRYGEGKLTTSTGWSDLSKSMFSLSGKTFIIYLIIGMIVGVLAGIFALILGFVFAGSAVVGFIVGGFFVFILLAGLFAFLPSLALIMYPAYFSEASNLESIKIAFRMGFRNWGNVIVTLLLAGIAIYIVTAILSVPNIIVMLFTMGEVNILTFIFGFLSILGNVLTYPIMFIFIAFQYFSIVESEQGISLQSKVDEFENL